MNIKMLSMGAFALAMMGGAAMAGSATGTSALDDPAKMSPFFTDAGMKSLRSETDFKTAWMAMKPDELVACNAIDRLWRWRHNRIRMVAKHDSRNHLTGKKRWLSALLAQTLFRVLLRQLDLVFRKRRLEDNFSHQTHDRIVELGQRRSRNYRVIGIRARRETRADTRDFVGDLSAGL